MQGSKGDMDVKSELLDSVGEGKGRNDLREQHGKMYITMCKIGDQCKLEAWSRAPKSSALEQPRGMGREVRGGFRMGGTCIPVAY